MCKRTRIGIEKELDDKREDGEENFRKNCRDNSSGPTMAKTDFLIWHDNVDHLKEDKRGDQATEDTTKAQENKTATGNTS